MFKRGTANLSKLEPRLIAAEVSTKQQKKAMNLMKNSELATIQGRFVKPFHPEIVL